MDQQKHMIWILLKLNKFVRNINKSVNQENFNSVLNN